MKFSAAISLFATMVVADWTSQCSSWSSSSNRRSLKATCTSDSGSEVCSTLDLNDCLAFNGSALIWQVDGNFSPVGASLNDGIAECVNAQELCTYLSSSSSSSTDFECYCYNPDSSSLVDVSIDLAEQISVNGDGYLTCLGQVASSC
ncbi:hypothetical protein B0T10DRAFT_611460 [Thelonectria olida]|uniref:Cyanovirin-N domain-containing protein n=1 Tax=Thelonectria olida TaxID=1576542 RepID=A0A9P9AEJ7_9HYPO|nr:hypothetical protein B0T10DRAFT_611460 [Thelonectria olida]